MTKHILTYTFTLCLFLLVTSLFIGRFANANIPAELRTFIYANSLKFDNLSSKLNEPLLTEISHDGQFIYRISAASELEKYDTKSQTLLKKLSLNYALKYTLNYALNDGINSMAISNDGNYIALTTTTNQIQLINTNTFNVFQTIEPQLPSSIGVPSISVVNASPRYSFIFTFNNKKEIWEMPYSDKGGVEVFKGWAHDYRKDSGEGKVETWKLTFSDKTPPPFRIIKTADHLDNIFFDEPFIHIVGSFRERKTAVAINLDAQRKVANFNKKLLVNPLSFTSNQREVFLSSTKTIEQQQNTVHVVNIESGEILKEITLPDPVAFYTTHASSPYIWVVSNAAQLTNQLHWINKSTLSIHKNIPINVNKKISQISFSQQGNYILINTDDDFLPIIYNNATFTRQLVTNE